VARNPKCDICPISHFCKYFEQHNTATALKKKEDAEAKKAKQKLQRLKKDKIAKELKKRAVG
jgi:endonuclease-3